MCKHYDCVCYAPTTDTCDYILIYGERRGCAPTDDCIHYRTDYTGTRPVRLPQALRKVDLARVNRMKAVYNPKAFVEDMAIKADVTKGEMLSWVRKEHPEHKLLRLPT